MKLSSFIMIKMLSVLIAIVLFAGLAFGQVDSSVANDTRMWNDPQAWKDGTVPTASDNVVISPGATINNITEASCASLTISSGAFLSPGSGTLYVGGDWTNNGAFLLGTSTVVFNGTAEQTISGSSITVFYNLIDSNTTAYLTIAKSPNINSTLTVAANATINMLATARFNESEGAQGTLTGDGTVRVTMTNDPATFTAQYPFSTYTLSNLTVDYAGTAAQQVSSGLTYGNLTISNNSDIVGASGNFNITGTFTIGTGAIFSPSTSTVINNGGAAGIITGTGQVQTGNTSTTNKDFDSQYKFLTYTLDNLEVNYTEGGMSLSNHTYGNLTIDGNIFGKATATVSKKFVAGSFQPSGGTMIFTDSAKIIYNGMNFGPEFQDVLIQTGAYVTTSTAVMIKGSLTVKSNASFIATNNTTIFSDAVSEDDNITNEGTLVLHNVSIWGDIGTSTDMTINGILLLADGSSYFNAHDASVITLNGSKISPSVDDDLGTARFHHLKLGNDLEVGIDITIIDTLDIGSHTVIIDSTKYLLYDPTNDVTAVLIGDGEIFGYTERSFYSGLEGTPLTFGNQDTKITFYDFGNAEGLRVGVFPDYAPGDSGAVTRYYNISPQPSGTGYLAKLQLHYNEDDLNGNHEERLVLQRKNGSTYEPKGATLNDTLNNFVVLDSVNQFSTWTLKDADLIELTVADVYAFDKDYDGTTTATLDLSIASLSGVSSGDSVTLVMSNATGAFSDKNAGVGKTVTVSGFTISGADANKYYLTQPTTTATISALSVEGTVTVANKVYDATSTATITDRTLIGVIPGDSVFYTGGTATFDSKHAGTGKSVTVSGLTLTGADKDNYSVFMTGPGIIADIEPAPLTVTLAAGIDKIYDGTTDASVDFSGAVLNGVFSGDDVDLASGSYTAFFNDANVGINKSITISGLGLSGIESGNYYLSSFPTASADITKRTVTAVVFIQDKVFDGDVSATIDSLALDSVIPGDTVSLAGGTAQFDTAIVGNNRLVNISGLYLTGVDTINYWVDENAISSASITPKVLTVVFSVDSKEYDGTRTATIFGEGLNGIEAVAPDVNVSIDSAEFDSKNVGVNKTVIARGVVLGGVDSYNYIAPDTAIGTGDITPKPCTTSVTIANKVYDGDKNAIITSLGFDSSNVVPGDSISISGGTAFFDDKNVGTNKDVIATAFQINGPDGENYIPLQALAKAEITHAEVTVSGALALDKVYDASPTATVVFANAQLNGVVKADDVTLDTTIVSAVFDTKNAGSNKPITVTSLILDGADKKNYTLIQPKDSASIYVDTLAVTGITAENKEYDRTTSATIDVSSAVLNGAFAGDTVALVTTGATGAFSDKFAGTGKTVAISGLTLSGTDENNYTIGNTSATADITQKSLVGSITAANKVYDGTTLAVITSRSLSGVITGDSVLYSGGSAAFDSEQPGTGKTVTATGLSLTGQDSANYSVNSTAIATASILAEAINIASGDWTADSIWELGTVPTRENPTRIVSGTTVALTGKIFTDTSLTIEGTLRTGTNIVAGNANFTLANGATLEIGSAHGISSNGATGNIQVSGVRTFGTGANYTYNSGSNQISGNGLPATVNNLTIADSTSVSLTNDVAVNGTLTVGTSTTALLNPNSLVIIGGTGTLTGYGTIKVSRTANTADFNTQYAIANKTLSNLTVEYNGEGDQIVNNYNYYNVTFSDAGKRTFAVGATGISGTLTIGPNIIVDATTNSSTINFNGAGNQNINRLQYHGLGLTNSGVKTFASDTTSIAGILTINGTATADALTNFSTIRFNGSGYQSITGIQYYNLIIDKTNLPAYIHDTLSVFNDMVLNKGSFSTMVDLQTNSLNADPNNLVFINRDLYLSDSSSFFANYSTIEIRGVWNNASDRFVPGFSLVRFLSSDRVFSQASSQGISPNTKIKGTGSLQLHKLYIDDDMTSEINLTVNDSLVLNANLDMGSDTLTLGSNAQIYNPASSAQYDVYGAARRYQASLSTGKEYSFSNQYTTITFDSGIPSSDVTMVTSPGVAQTLDSANSIERSFQIDAVGTFSSTLKFHYNDDEMNGNTEGNLNVWKIVNGNLVDMGKTARDTTQNWVSADNIDEFSLWTLADATPPLSHIHTWLGVVSNSWHTSGNWVNAFPPDGDSSDVIIIPDSLTTPFIALLPQGDTVTAAQFIIESNGSLYGSDGSALLISDSLFVDSLGVFYAGNNNILAIGGNFNNAGLIYGKNSSIEIKGDWNSSGLFVPDTGSTVIFTGNNQLIDNGVSTFWHFTHDGNGTISLAETLFVSGDFTNTKGNFRNNHELFTVNGKSDIRGDTVFIQDEALFLGTVTIAGGRLDASSGYMALNDFQMDSGSFYTDLGSILVLGNWIVNGGTVTITSNTFFIFWGAGKTQYVKSGNNSFAYLYHFSFTAEGDSLILLDDLNITGLFQNYVGTFVTNGYNLSVTGSLPPLSAKRFNNMPKRFKMNLNLGESSGISMVGGKFVGSSGSITTGDFALHEAEFVSSSSDFTVNGNWLVYSDGVFEHNNGTVTFRQSGGTQLLQTSGYEFYNINHTGSATLQIQDTNLVVRGNFVNRADFDANGFDVTVYGYTNLLGGGKYYAKSGEQSFIGGLSVTNGSFIGDSGKVTIGSLFAIGDTVIAPLDTLKILGSITYYDGAFIHNNSTAIFTGGNTHTIDQASAKASKQGTVANQELSFNHLIIEDSTVSLIPLSVQNDLLLKNNLVLELGATLTLLDSAVVLNLITPAQYDVHGTVRRLQADIQTGKELSFNNQYSTIMFDSGTVTSDVEMTLYPRYDVTLNQKESVLRNYDISAVGSFSATLKLNYQDDELNNNIEDSLTLWRDDGITGYINKGRTSLDTAGNMLTLSGVTEFSRWAIGDGISIPLTHIHTWLGNPQDGSWYEQANWVNNNPPDGHPTDVIVIPDSNVALSIPMLPAVDTVTAQTFIIEKDGRLYGAFNSALQISGEWMIDSGATFIAGDENSFAVNGNFNNAGNFNALNSAMMIGGDWNNTGLFVADSGNIVTFNGANQTVLTNGSSFEELYHSGTGALSLLSALQVNGSFVNNSGNVLIGNNGLNIVGNCMVNADTMLADTVVSIGGTLSINGGVFIHSARNMSVGGVLIQSGALYATPNFLSVTGNWSVSGSGVFVPQNGYVYLNGNGNQSITSGGQEFYWLGFNGGTDTLEITDNLTVANALVIDGGVFNTNGHDITVNTGASLQQPKNEISGREVLGLSNALAVQGGVFIGGSGDVNASNVFVFSGTFYAPSGEFNVSGNWLVNTGTFIPGSGTVTFTKSSGVQTLNSGGQSFANIIHSGNGTLQLLYSALLTDGDFTNSGGVFDANENAVTINGATLVSGGRYLARSSTQLFSNGLNISHGSFVGESGRVLVYGTLTIGDTLIMPTDTLDVSGDFINNGTFIHSGGTIRFNGASWQRISGVTSFHNVVVDGIEGDSLKNDMTILGTLNILGGKVEIGSNWLNLWNAIAGSDTNLHGDGTSSLSLEGSSGEINIPYSISALKHLRANNSSGTTLQANLTVVDSLEILAGELRDNGYTVTVQGGVLNLGLHSGMGRIKLANGSAKHILRTYAGSLFGTLELDDSYGASLSGPLAIHDSLVIQTGTLRTNADTVILSTGASLRETMENTVFGKIRTSSVLNAFVQENFGGIGLMVIPGSDVAAKTVRITRVNDTIMTGVNNAQSIRRYFDIPLADSITVDEIVFSYDVTEKNNLDTASMVMYRSSNNGATWISDDCDSSLGYDIIRNKRSKLFGRWTGSDMMNQLALPILSVLYTTDDHIFRFDTMFVNEYSLLQVNIKNTGNGLLQIDSLKSGSSIFTLVGNYTDLCLPPESVKTINVQVAPVSAGEDTSRIILYHNDHVIGSPLPVSLRLLTFNRKYPGDTDNDLVVTIRDIVPIGFYYHQTGETEPTPRPTGEHYLPFRGWSPDSLAEFKARADCNGDGIVDTGDVRIVADILGATIYNSRYEVYHSIFMFAQGLSAGRFRNDLLAFANSYKETNGNVPAEWSLQQNYPNPFNGTTVIRYGLPVSAQTVRLVIYDVLGRAIKTIVQNDLKEGWYDVPWDGLDDKGASVSTGVYFYRLEYPVASSIKKLLYVR